MQSVKFHDFGFLERKEVNIDWLMVLNQPLYGPLLDLLLPCSRNIIAVDGGAKRLYQHDKSIKIQSIVGDLDSVEPQTRKYYEDIGVKIELLYDQDRNDFDKAIQYVMKRQQKCRLWVLGALGGRLDHTFQNLHTSLISAKNWQQLEITLISQENMAHILRPNTHYHLKQSSFEQKYGCSILSFDEAAITTRGLRWNLPALRPTIKFGHYISTSNEVVGQEVEIESSQIFIWTTSLKKF